MTDEIKNDASSSHAQSSANVHGHQPKGVFEKTKEMANQISDAAKKRFEEAGGVDGLKAKGKEAVNKAKEIGAQGISTAQQKFTDAGGMPGLKSKGTAFLGEVKAGFHPDEGSTGIKRIISRVANLWRSGGAGKISIIIIGTIALIAVSDIGNEQDEEQGSNNGSVSEEDPVAGGMWTSQGSNRSKAESTPQGKTKKIGMWSCSQCGDQIESSIRTSGKCPSRNNAPHAWTRKGEEVISDTGQKETIWQCRQCFTVMTRPGGAPPSGIRCPSEKNASHRFDKIGEK